MKTNIYIRVDGNLDIGLGHVTRCIALAEMLIRDFNVCFIFKNSPDSISKELINSKFGVTKIQSEREILNFLEKGEILVIDHYELGVVYQKKLKDHGCKVVCIDDFNDKSFFADLIINHSPFFQPENYNAQPYTKFAFGLKYALLRPAFLNSKRKTDITSIRSILICFGGADKLNYTEIVLKVILKHKRFNSINIVVGHSYIYLKELNDFCKEFSNVNLFVGIDDIEMVKIMESSDLAIVPTSGILLEALSVGLRIVTTTSSENYVNFRKLDHDSIVTIPDFSEFNIVNAIKELESIKTYKAELIDKKSRGRILKLFKSLSDS